MRPERALENGAPPTEATQAERARAETRSRILSASYDKGLLFTREQLLRTTPHEVVAVGSLEEALKQARVKDFDLVILCHTIPERHASVLIDEVRKRSRARVLILGQSTYTLTQAQRSEGGGPPAFLRAVNAILAGKPGKAPSWLLYDQEKQIYRTG